MTGRHEARQVPATRTVAITTRMNIQGMDWAGCAIKIEDALRSMPGIERVDASVPRRRSWARPAEPGDSFRRRISHCRVIWRSGNRIGVRFAGGAL